MQTNEVQNSLHLNNTSISPESSNTSAASSTNTAPSFSAIDILYKTSSSPSAVSSPSNTTIDDDVYDTKQIITDYTMHSKGCLGRLERIPLAVKLACMNGFWFMGMLAFCILLIILRSKILATGVAQAQFNKFIVVAGNLVHELQKERGLTSMHLYSNRTAYFTRLRDQRMRTDVALNSWDSYFASNEENLREDVTIRQDINAVSQFRRQLSSVRGLQFNVERTRKFYTDWTLALLSILYSTLGTLNKYAVIVALKEKAAYERGIVSGMLAGQVTTAEDLNQMLLSMHDQSLLQYLFFKIARQDDIGFYQSVMRDPEMANIAAAEAVILGTPSGTAVPMNPTEWFDMMTGKVDKYKIIEDHFAIQMQSNKDVRDSAILIAVICFTLLLFLSCSVFIVILFSKVIIKPWKRLHELQEDTITKFVPRGFLRLINVKQITDVQMGTAVSRDLTALFTDIRDFTSISERLTPEKTFEFVNLYLNEVGPVVRKQGGYIDKFLGDGFMALFTNAHNGLQASIEIQQKLREFCRDIAFKYMCTPMRVGIGVHSGKMMVGTVGENKRMDGSIIGDAVNLTARLESLTKRYKANILTTSCTLLKIPSTVSQFRYRYIGKVRVKGKEQEIDVFEVLDGSDEKKVETREEFSRGVIQMIQCNFEEAKMIFERIVRDNPDDYAAQLKLDQCISFLQAGEHSWDGCSIAKLIHCECYFPVTA